MTTTSDASQGAASDEPASVSAFLQDPGAFALTVDEDQTGTVVWVQGELDVATSPQLRELLGGMTDGDGPLVLDMSGVAFLDSTGLGALLGAKHRLQDAGRELVLRAPTRSVLRVLEVSALSDTFTIT